MARLLEAGETGFGILIERDAGYIGNDLNEKFVVNENFKVELGKPIFVNSILQKWGVKNQNGRIYPKDILVNQVNEYQKMIDNGSSPSEADHPESSVISLLNISHLITKMWWGKGEKENILFGQIRLIVTPGFIKYGIASVVGDKVLLYMQNGLKLGISSRGVGTLKDVDGENYVQDDFELIGFDLVSTPSTPGAYLFPGVDIDDQGNIGEGYKKKNGVYVNENKKIIDAFDKFLL